MSNLYLRMATKEDVYGILPLIEDLGYPSDIDLLTKRFERFMKGEGYGIVVATNYGKIIGWVAWSKSQTFVMDKVRIHIEGIIVSKDHKGRGIGKKLMNFVEEFARQFGEVIIDLTSGMRRAKDGTHEFYRSLGYSNEGNMAKLYLRKEIK